MRKLGLSVLFLLTMCGAMLPLGSAAQAAGQSMTEVLQSFQQEEQIAPERAIADKSKHQILFWMGLALLVLILATASFGIAVGIYEKDVYLWHMLCAGLSVTLAIAHAVVAIVWFYPD